MRDLNYRPDIDGLRAVAVLSVVAYHVGIPGFPGGFVGVDVFFVISGYLITRLLTEEMDRTQSIDLLAFYARRARRLLPAFFLVLIATLILGSIFLLPVDKEQERLAQSAIAATLYYSNFFFIRVGGGYFDGSSDLYPLLHTWSLAVEEQFYLVWPVMLLGIIWLGTRWNLGRNRLVLIALAVIFGTSLIGSMAAVWGGEQSARVAFFGLHTRAWELALGALLAVLGSRLTLASTAIGAGLSLAGLAFIAFAVTQFNDSTPFPGASALVPTIGAALLIAGGIAAPAGTVTKALSLRPLVGVGLVSYGWYLWHWPLLAIARAHDLGTRDLARDAAIAAVALILAVLTYVYVERPFRHLKIEFFRGSLRTLFVSAAASLIVFACARGMYSVARHAAQSEPMLALNAARSEFAWSRKRCHQDDDSEIFVSQAQCLGSSATKDNVLFVWGDSHAEHLTGMLEAAWPGIAILPRSRSGCPPLLNVTFGDAGSFAERCIQFNQLVQKELISLAAERRLIGIVLSARWAHYLDVPHVSGSSGNRVALLDANANSNDTGVAFQFGLTETLRFSTSLGVNVVVVLTVPGQRFRVPPCLARRSAQDCSVDRLTADFYRKPASDAIAATAEPFENVRVWDPFQVMCRDHCLVKNGNIVMYRDEDHLTYQGSKFLGRTIENYSDWFLRDPVGHPTSIERKSF